MADPLQVLETSVRALDPSTFIEPPNWAVRLVSTNAGKRGRKYPSTWMSHNQGIRVYPGGSAEDYMPWGMDHSGGYEARYQQSLREREDRESKIVIRGNLREEEYRFWNGSQSVSTDIATCRWCRHWAYGHDAMRLHQSRTDHTRILREIYDTARQMNVHMCFTCGARTRHERWGIPLCNSNRCLNKWRVAPIVEISSTLLMYAKFARKKGLLTTWLNEDGSEKYNTETTPKQFNWERASAY